MHRVEKTVFISYRRTHAAWALAVFQNLTQHGYDVFFDFEGIASGDFERVILENIRARAHFLVLLTPSTLQRFNEPEDCMRWEIETALESRRNIVPVLFEGFDFSSPAIAELLVGKLAELRRYNALAVPVAYFAEAMDRMRERYLNVPLDAVLHPASSASQKAANEQQVAAGCAPQVQAKALSAEEWYEQAFEHCRKADADSALRDFGEAIRLQPDYADAYLCRATLLGLKGDFENAIRDYGEAIRLKPDADTYYSRANAHRDLGDLDGALRDYGEAVRLKPDCAVYYYERGLVHSVFVPRRKSAFGEAVLDFKNATRLTHEHADDYDRAKIEKYRKFGLTAAIADFPNYLRLRSSDASIQRADVKRAMDHVTNEFISKTWLRFILGKPH